MRAISTEQLVSDLKLITRDAEQLLQAASGEIGEKAKDMRHRLTTAVESAKEACLRLQERAVAGAKATDKVVREHPYQSIGVAFGIGALIGFLMARK